MSDPSGQLVAQRFGELTDIPLLADDGAAYTGPDHPTNLNDVMVHESVAEVLNRASGAAELLATNGFVIVPGVTPHFFHIYEGAEYVGFPTYVTTDAAYHVWHLVFDKILREAEQQSLLPHLENLLTRLVATAREQEAEVADTPLEPAANRVRQFYEAAAALAELDVGAIGPLAEEEVELARAADQIEVSPTIGVDLGSAFVTLGTDYTLFKPRGHYTRNGDLERFFRAMSQLGNNAFLTAADESLQLGILATRALLADESAVASWRRIYEPTAFLIGVADDYTPFETDAAVQTVVANGWDDVQAFADLASVQAIRDELAKMRTVEINPEAASVRVMGTRFVIDSFILDSLVAPQVPGRMIASPLDVAATFGSEWALSTQEDLGNTDYPNYDQSLQALRELVATWTIDDWGSTVYNAWLYAMEPMWHPRGPQFPGYMQSDAWQAKAHQTGLGSYAELKHDTILYTKQAVAQGGGAEPPDPPRHWVEPDPVPFERLAAVTELLHDGLAERDLLPQEYVQLLDDLEHFLRWLGSIARDELAGIPISDEDNNELRWIGGLLESYWIRTSDLDLDWENGPDSHAALIADIMRSGAGGVVEVGTGFVDRIFVLVPRDDGVFQVAVGGVYSYYEFLNEQRLSDEEWRSMLEGGTAPARPSWQGPILRGDVTSPSQQDPGLEAGLLCRDIHNRDHDYFAAAAYWIREGSPSRMDIDGNGVPCETVFARTEIDEFLAGATGFGPGALCRDLGLPDDHGGYLRAVAYWMLEGTPDRMDADGNGIPCETVFSSEAIDNFFRFIP